MGIFTKLSTVIRSNINDLIARAENPEKMLNQIILDMREQLTKAKQEVAVAIADERKLKAQAEEEMKQAQEWERRAMLAVQAQGADIVNRVVPVYMRLPNPKHVEVRAIQDVVDGWFGHELVELRVRPESDRPFS